MIELDATQGDDPRGGAVSPGSGEPGRYDAFVSYSRIDAVMAEALDAQLHVRGVNVWLDVEGIVGGEDWKARITRAIEACNAFIFLVSPDSLHSAVCAEELARAVELNKLIIPVHCRDVDRGELVPALVARDPVWLRASDPHEEGLGRLVAMLQRDVTWRERHTQIAVRARGWLDANRDPGRLLVGSDLRNAETWLGTRSGDGQLPTVLHDEYIRDSRRAAGMRQRRRMGAALVALAIAAALAGFAVAARNAAVAGKQVALSRSLAAQAGPATARDPGLAAALSVEADRVRPTAQARAALAGVLPRLGEWLGELRGSDFVRSVAISPDGRMIASGGLDGALQLWERATRRAIGGSFRSRSRIVWSVAFSPDGTTLASGGSDGTVRLWDVASRRQIGSPLGRQRKSVLDVAFSSDAKAIASAGADGTLRLWDVASHREIAALPVGRARSPLMGLSFSPDGRMLAACARDGSVRLWNAATRRLAGAPIAAHAGRAHAVVFAPDGKTLASGGSDGTVRLWDVATHRLKGAPFVGAGPRARGGVRDVTFAPDGKTLAITGAGVRLWDVATRRPSGPKLTGDATVSVAAANTVLPAAALFSPDGKTLVSSGTRVGIWNVAARGPHAPTVRPFVLYEPTAGAPGAPLGGDVAYSPDSRTIAITDGVGRVGLWDVATRGLRGARIAPPAGERILKAVFVRGGRMLATAGEDGTVRLWSRATRREVGAPLRGHTGLALAVAASRDGRILASAGTDKTVRLWSVTRRHRLGVPLRGHRGPVLGLAFSPDARTLASAASDSTVRLWDVARGRPTGPPLTASNAGMTSVAFSPDGRLLATGGMDGAVRLWDVAARRLVAAPLRGHTGIVARVAFSSDGSTLASASFDKTVRLWSVARRHLMGAPLRGYIGAINVLAFSPDGATLVGSTGITARLWDSVLWTGDQRTQRARACAAGRRNLSRSEWSGLLPGEPYHETCRGA